jgi:uncharacterized protein (TIGR03086 family)
VLALVTADDLMRQPPCNRWDGRDVLLHLADVADALSGMAATGTLVMPEPSARDTDPVAIATGRLALAHEAIWRSAEGVGGRTLGWALAAARSGTIELSAHAWDLATACHREANLDDGTARAALALATALLTDDAREPNFASRVTLPETAAPTDALVAFLGRRPTRGEA